MSKSNPPGSTAVQSNRTSDGSSRTGSSAAASQRLPYTPSYGTVDGNRKSGILKSQYPRDAGENHVEYILVASFDIDQGPIMENQYPGAIKGDQHMLAELMLPDQAHVRNQDWTIFFLHKDTNVQRPGGVSDAVSDGCSPGDSEPQLSDDDDDDEGQDRLPQPPQINGTSFNDIKTDDEEESAMGQSNGAAVSERAEEQEQEQEHEQEQGGDDEEEEEGEEGEDEQEDDDEPEGGPPLVYVLNLVNTKQDPKAPRGALVKAMAICTRHSFLHIYKPLLLLALEDYFKAPYPETLAALYDAVNSMDLSLMPRLSIFERYILQASDTKDLFIEKFAQMIKQRQEDDQDERPRSADLASSSGNPMDGTPQVGNGHWLGGQPRYSLPRDTHEFETRVVYNGIPIPIKVPTALSPETVGGFSLIRLIQVFSTPHAKDPQPFMLHPHLTTNGAYTHPITVLANAMLTQKRVIFLGHNRPSNDVAEAVLAACALASGGILRGFTRHAFPYTDLSKIDDLLKVPGFVAGVTNPAFAHHPEWWDLLCDLESGRMKISPKIEPAPMTEGLINFQQQSTSLTNVAGASATAAGADATGDQAFMDDILRSIVSRHGEAVIRAKWRDWVVKFTRIAAAFEESVYGASALWIGGDEASAEGFGMTGHGYVWSDEASRQRELTGSVSRIEGWRNTRSYYSFIQDLAQLYTLRPMKSLDLHHLHDRLRTQKLSMADSGAIYQALSSRVHSYAEICQLLTVTPESHAGLFYISLGLLHPQPDVRVGVVGLITRIREHTAGRHFWNGLNSFAKLAFMRMQKKLLAGREGHHHVNGTGQAVQVGRESGDTVDEAGPHSRRAR